jgi:hypothetical protein
MEEKPGCHTRNLGRRFREEHPLSLAEAGPGPLDVWPEDGECAKVRSM